MDNRGQILNQALELFAARGYEGVGVQEICTAAGVTKPTLYHYFGSKRGLLATLLEERTATLLARLAAATAYAGDLPVSLARVAEEYFAFASAEPTLCRLLLALWFHVPTSEAFAVVHRLNTAQHQLVEALFVQAASDHGNMRGRQRIFAATLLGVLNTYIALALNGSLQLGPAEVQQAVRQFSHGIYS